jgi:hypothetical protein
MKIKYTYFITLNPVLQMSYISQLSHTFSSTLCVNAHEYMSLIHMRIHMTAKARKSSSIIHCVLPTYLPLLMTGDYH